MESLDKNGKDVFSEILDLAAKKSFTIHWGTKGFSLNVDKNGAHVALCYGYPPSAVYKQSIYTALVGRGGLLSKLDVSESEINGLWQEALATKLFQPAGRELKALINRKLSNAEIQTITDWLVKVATAIDSHQLK